jgi:hypothetical protein
MKHKLYGVMVFRASLKTKITFVRKYKDHYAMTDYKVTYKNWRRIERLTKDYPMQINPHDNTLSIVWTIRPMD